MKNGPFGEIIGTAENSANFLRFSAAKPAVQGGVNWYTFESLAKEIRTVRTVPLLPPLRINTLVRKEETETWS
jgi:hypothetical protein